LTPLLGELAALTTSMCYSGSSVLYTFAGRKLTALVINRIRLILAVLLLVSVHWVFQGVPFPIQAGLWRWFWLGTSGIIGLALGDFFLFRAYQSIGPRLSSLMMSLAPILVTLMAWMFFGEALSNLSLLGIALTVGGIAWVILERPAGQIGLRVPAERLRGILFGLGATISQAMGVILAKEGLMGGIPAVSANVIRMISAMVALWVLTLFQKQARQTFNQVVKQARAVPLILGGAILGPFLGVSLSLYSLQRADAGVASTLSSLAPIFLLPISYFIFKERFGWTAILGTMMALAGVALLFLV
jgi:drug/metabolite transporter (DMT)-like permease